MPKTMDGLSDGEEGVSADLLVIRSMLKSLPTVNCAPGFEYRLQNRLSADEAGVRSGSSVRNWTLGWAGAGLGFATALAIAFFAFDLNVKSPSVPMVNNSTLTGVSQNGPSSPVTPQVVSVPRETHPMTSPQTALSEKQIAQAKEDSMKKAPPSKVDLPQDYMHVVGTNQGPHR